MVQQWLVARLAQKLLVSGCGHWLVDCQATDLGRRGSRRCVADPLSIWDWDSKKFMQFHIYIIQVYTYNYLFIYDCLFAIPIMYPSFCEVAMRIDNPDSIKIGMIDQF